MKRAAGKADKAGKAARRCQGGQVHVRRRRRRPCNPACGAAHVFVIRVVCELHYACMCMFLIACASASRARQCPSSIHQPSANINAPAIVTAAPRGRFQWLRNGRFVFGCCVVSAKHTIPRIHLPCPKANSPVPSSNRHQARHVAS